VSAEQLRKAFEASKLAKANQTTVKILQGKVRKAEQPKTHEAFLKTFYEDKNRKTGENRKRILQEKVAKASTVSLKI